LVPIYYKLIIACFFSKKLENKKFISIQLGGSRFSLNSFAFNLKVHSIKTIYMNFKIAITLSPMLLITLLVGCTSKVEETKTPALFDTRREALKAAKSFNCTGAHKMGNKWMPCKTHEFHENADKKKHNHHHH